MLSSAVGRRRGGSSDRAILSPVVAEKLGGCKSRMLGDESVRTIPERVHRSAVPAPVLTTPGAPGDLEAAAVTPGGSGAAGLYGRVRDERVELLSR